MQGTETKASEKLLTAAALDSLVAEFGEDFTDFVTLGERAEMIEERITRIRKFNSLDLAA